MHRRLLRATGPATSCRPTRAQNRFVCRAANIDVADMSALKPKKGTFCCTRRAASHAAQGASCGLAPLPVSQGIPFLSAPFPPPSRPLPAPLPPPFPPDTVDTVDMVESVGTEAH